VAGYSVYQLVQILVVGSRRSAVERATWVFSTEQHLHLDPEVWLNHVVAQHYWLIVVTGLYYGILHFTITPLVLVWVRIRRPDRYAALRNTLVGVSLAALIMYWLLPLAPPRLSIPAVIDTMKVHDILSAANPHGLAALANQYAAMPSLHVAWAVWAALAVVVAFPSSRIRHLAWLYPISTALIVMATGNHFLTDTVAATLLVWATWAITHTLDTHNPTNQPTHPNLTHTQHTNPLTEHHHQQNTTTTTTHHP
jgi:hypothetical protein